MEHITYFNGDFVDRGNYGVEIVLTLLAFKSLSPQSIHLNRGNHETRSMNKMYGFYEEMVQKYGETYYDLAMEIFKMIPVAHIIEGGDESSKQYCFFF